MSYCEHLDAFGQFFEHYVVLEAGHGKSSRFACNHRDSRARAWEALDQFESPLHLAEETFSNLGTPLAIPCRSIAKILAGEGLNKNRLQRCNTLARISSSATRQSSPRSFPA